MNLTGTKRGSAMISRLETLNSTMHTAYGEQRGFDRLLRETVVQTVFWGRSQVSPVEKFADDKIKGSILIAIVCPSDV